MIAVFGHRGARGLAPENTLPGFFLASRLGVTGVELDIRLTADKIPVIHHDARPHPDIARIASGAYVGAAAPLIRDLTRHQLADFDVGRLRRHSDYARQYPAQQGQDGVRIPTLAEVLAACPVLDLLVEIKSEPDAAHPPAELATQVLQVLSRAGATSRAVIFAFDWRILEEMARLAPSLRRGCLTDAHIAARTALRFGPEPKPGVCERESPGSLPRAVARTGAVIWAPDHKTINAAELAEAHRLGLAVIPWTVNDHGDIRRMIELQVDGIISDVPDQAIALLAAHGMTPAPPGFIDRLSP
jgi:glycerophosphoryl diester phosphodiesterase